MGSVNILRTLASGLLFWGLICLGGCLNRGFDAPPDMSGYDPDVPVTHSIAQLKAMNGAYNSTIDFDTTLISRDVVIAGIITADDRSGNFYKQIVIQDATGGLTVCINAYNLYNHYAVGRKVYIRCKGLYLGYDGGLPVLGSAVSEQKMITGLISTEIDAHIIKAGTGHFVKDTVITLAQAKLADPFFYNLLVTIADAEFLDTTKTYTEPSATTNRYLVNCAANKPPAGQQLAVRSSNYAGFHALSVPAGHGTLTGIFTVYQASPVSRTAQLMIRDTGDVKLYQPRCMTGPSAPPNRPLITIDSLRRLFPGAGNYTLPACRITGVIISDIDAQNVAPGNFIIQDGSGKGLILYLSGSTVYKRGDSVAVDMTGCVLKLFNGTLEAEQLTTAKINVLSSGKAVIPVPVTIAALNADFSRYESTLIKVSDAIITAGGTYSGSKSLSDAGGAAIILYTAAGATFAARPVLSVPGSYTAIPSWFNTTKRISIRDLTDVQ